MSPNPPSSYSTASTAKPPPRYIELRPKGEGLLITFPNGASGGVDSRRKRHALSQKNQRDRLKAALEQMARVLHTGGAGTGQKGGSGTKVELIETAVEYIQSLEKEVSLLRTTVREVSRNDEGAECLEPQPASYRDE